MSQTLDDLNAAFAGESQANRKYTSFAQKADQEGYAQAARLFRAAALGEAYHAHNHLAAMEGIHSTAENLKEAMGGENWEVDSMYPPMIAAAEAEGNRKAVRSFRWAMEVEKVHAKMYEEALNTLGQQAEEYNYYVCPVCGFVSAHSAPERCPVCGNPGEKFVTVQ